MWHYNWTIVQIQHREKRDQEDNKNLLQNLIIMDYISKIIMQLQVEAFKKSDKNWLSVVRLNINILLSYYGREIGQAIIFLQLWFLLSSSFFILLYIFLDCSQRSQIGCLPYFHTWCGLSANLAWNLLHAVAENTARKNSPFAHHCTTLSGATAENRRGKKEERNHGCKI